MKNLKTYLIILVLLFTMCLVACGDKTDKTTTTKVTNKSEETREHTHNYEEVITEATCGKAGEKVFTCVCGDTYSEEIPALEHSYNLTNTVNATCISNGTKTFTCSLCNDIYTESISATGHAYGVTNTVNATCSSTGTKTFTCSLCNDIYTESISATGHAYSVTNTVNATCSSTGTKTFTCSNCKDSYTESIAQTKHTWIEATCTAAKKCSVCSITEGVALGHSKNSNNICDRCGKNLTTYGQVKGQITWQYNDFVGTRGDNGATVMLIPDNDNVKNYDNSGAAMRLTGTYDSGIIVVKCDGYGNFDFGNKVSTGKYKLLVISANTTSGTRFNNEELWLALTETNFKKYFSGEDFETLKLHMGYQSICYANIELEEYEIENITYDFGNTYI